MIRMIYGYEKVSKLGLRLGFFTRYFLLFQVGFLLFYAVMATRHGIASDFHSPRTASLGGAGHAGPLLNDALYLNPSFTSFLNTYGISGSYLLYSGDLAQYRGHNLNLSILDGRSELFQAGVGYTWREDAKLFHVGASKTILNQLGVGLGGKFFFPHQPNESPAREATLSTTFIAANWLQVVGIIDNLFDSSSGQALGLYRELILGTKFNVMGVFLVYLDPHWTPSLPEGQAKWGVESGIEFPVMSDFFLRGGLFRASAYPQANIRGTGYGFGMGWLGPKISVDYGFSKMTDPFSITTHDFGVTIYF